MYDTPILELCNLRCPHHDYLTGLARGSKMVYRQRQGLAGRFFENWIGTNTHDMKKIAIELTKSEWAILRKHFSQDISYGSGGTFGDGEEFHSLAEFKRAGDILYKIEKGIGLMK